MNVNSLSLGSRAAVESWVAVRATQGAESIGSGLWQRVARRIEAVNDVFSTKKQPGIGLIRRWSGNCPVCGRFQDSAAICGECRSDGFDA